MSGKSCLEQNQDEQFVSIKLYNIGKNPADSKPSNIYIGSHFMCDIKDSYEGKEPIESPFNIEKVTIKDEYYISKTEQINNVYETKEIKTEYEMGVINKEVKSEIGDEENDRELMANAQEIISRSPTTVFPSYSKTWLQREPPGREESETDLEDGKTDQGGENGTRNNPTITIDSSDLETSCLKKNTCKFCSKSFSRSDYRVLHERIHTGERPFQCKSCTRSFTRKDCLVEHERIHTGEKPFHCKVCLKSFSDTASVIEHESRNHGGEEKQFQCKVCSKSFAQKFHFSLHERTHTGEKPFKCKLCSKSFTQKCTLIQHERIHTGEKPFQCKFCSKFFAQRGNLVRHERLHT